MEHPRHASAHAENPASARAGAKTRISFFEYGEDFFMEKQDASPDECFEARKPGAVRWVNIDGVHDAALIEKFAERLGLHRLVVEDIMQTGRRPRLDDFGGYLFVVLKMVTLEAGGEGVACEQVSLVLAPGMVVSFQEQRPGDVFEDVRERIRKDKGRVRKTGADYLLYLLMEAVADGYFAVLERLGEEAEPLERALVLKPGREPLRKIHALKKAALAVRRAVWPLREVAAALERGESGLLQMETRVFFRDLYGHTIEAMDTVETLRETLSAMTDIYLSSASNRLNEVMKVLTIISTIFIPLTFIAGVYGMNFQHMPELKWRYGYFAVLFLMLLVALGMLAFFKRKKWIWF